MKSGISSASGEDVASPTGEQDESRVRYPVANKISASVLFSSIIQKVRLERNVPHNVYILVLNLNHTQTALPSTILFRLASLSWYLMNLIWCHRNLMESPELDSCFPLCNGFLHQ